MARIVLASRSEWRKKLMALLGLPYEVMESGVDEDNFTWEEPDEVVCTLATLKAEAVVKQLQGTRNKEHEDGVIVVGADTVISVDNPPSHKASEGHGQVIGKPKDMRDAKRIMQKLAGRRHEVWTGVCVIDGDTSERVVEVEKTEVTFRDIGDKALEKYLATGDWEGKAGAYQILGEIKPFVKEIKGSYTNVIGLPMITLVDMLERMGVWIEGDIIEVIMKTFGRSD